MTNNTSMTLKHKYQVSADSNLAKKLWQYKPLYLMLLPGLALFLVFFYGPMYGVILAFKDYYFVKGVWGSPWVGLKHFKLFFSSPDSIVVIKNTLLISTYRLIWGFPAPIILALMLNEVGHKFYKRLVQTVSYLPHFISWVVISGIVYHVLSPEAGIINYFIKSLGGQPVFFMINPRLFRSILVASDIWKEVGWSAIIYLAAITTISPDIYEAAIIDGTSRFQRILYITLPSILPLASLLLILSMGGILNAGFDQIFNMYNPAVIDVSDIIDTQVYRTGLTNMQYSYATAIGLFKSVVGLVLMLIANNLLRLTNGKGSVGLF